MTTLRGFSWAICLAAVLWAHSSLCYKTADPPTAAPTYEPVVVYGTRNSYTGTYDSYPPNSYNQKYRNSNPSYFGASNPPNSYNQNYGNSDPSYFDGSYPPNSYNQNYGNSDPSYFDGSYQSDNGDSDGVFPCAHPPDQNPSYENTYDQNPTPSPTLSPYNPPLYNPRRKPRPTPNPTPTPRPYIPTPKPTPTPTPRPNQPLDYCRLAEGAGGYIFSTFGPTDFQYVYKGISIGAQVQVTSTRDEMFAITFSEDARTLASLGFSRSRTKLDFKGRGNLLAAKVDDPRGYRPSCFIGSYDQCNLTFRTFGSLLYDYAFILGRVNVDFMDTLSYIVNGTVSRAMLERDNPSLARFCEEAGDNLYTARQ